MSPGMLQIEQDDKPFQIIEKGIVYKGDSKAAYQDSSYTSQKEMWQGKEKEGIKMASLSPVRHVLVLF